MKKLLLTLLIFTLLPVSMVGCGTLTANSAVSSRKIKAPKTGTLVYFRNSTKVDPNTISEVTDIQDLRLAIKGDVEAASGNGWLTGLYSLFKPTTLANRTFSEGFIASSTNISDSVISDVADKVFAVQSQQTDRKETANKNKYVEFSTNRVNNISSGGYSEAIRQLGESDALLKKLTEILNKDDIEDSDDNEEISEDPVVDGDTTNLFKESTNDDGSPNGRGAVALINAKYTGTIESVIVGGKDFSDATDWDRLPNGKREHWRQGGSAAPFNGQGIVVTLSDGTSLSGTISQTQASPFRGTFDLN